MADYSVKTVPLVVNINLSDIDKNLKKIDEFERAIERGTQIGVERFTKLLTERIKKELIDFGLGDSSLINDIVVVPVGGGFKITVANDYAMYIEYGTGIVGKQNPPHPDPQIPWGHDVNNYGDSGWTYKGKDGKYHWTKGQKSRPFMYNTWLYGVQYANRTIKYYINRELKRVMGVWE
jgi:hypothetical protein